MEKAKLLDVIELIGGSQPSKSVFINESQKNYVRLIQIRDFENDDKAVYVPEDSNLRFIEENDILLARYGASVGKVLTGKKGAYNVALMKVLPKEEKTTKEFIYYLLMSKQFQFFLKTISVSRAAQAGFSKNDLKRFSFYLPSIEEQERIAAQLNYIENLISLKKQHLNLFQKLIHSIYFQMFGDPVNNQKGFKKLTLNQIRDSKREITRGIENPGQNLEAGYPYLTTSNIKNGEIKVKTENFTSEETYKKFKRSICQTGDIIITIRASIGQAAVITKEYKDYNITRGLAVIPLNRNVVKSSYLICTIQSKGFQFIMQGNVKGTTFIQLNLDKLKGIQIPIPEIKSQEKFESFYDLIYELRSNMEQSLEILQQLFQVTLQNAFKPDVEINEEPIFKDLIRKFTVQDLRGNKQRLQYLINLFEQQNFDEFKDFTETRNILFKLMEEEEIIQTFDNEHKVKLKVK
jgi:type I restriction enzyme, S subunit